MPEITFVDELPDPKKRPAISQATIEQLRERPNVWGRIAYEGDGLTESVVRSRAISLRNYATRHGYAKNIEVSERTEGDGLATYARWVEKK